MYVLCKLEYFTPLIAYTKPAGSNKWIMYFGSNDGENKAQQTSHNRNSKNAIIST